MTFEKLIFRKIILGSGDKKIRYGSLVTDNNWSDTFKKTHPNLNSKNYVRTTWYKGQKHQKIAQRIWRQRVFFYETLPNDIKAKQMAVHTGNVQNLKLW